jgi:cytochrome c556
MINPMAHLMNRRRGIVPVSALAITLGLLVVASGVRPVSAQTAETRRLMQDKLARAQHLLEAIATSNYVMLERESAELSRIITAPGWEVLRSREFRTFSGDFRAAVDAINDAARRRDLDAAADHYLTVVASCYACHSYVKRQRVAR